MSKETELAWAAGFFDGEGTAGCYLHNKSKLSVQDERYCARMTIGQSDPEVLIRFQSAVGVGNVRGPYKYAYNKTPLWCWSLAKIGEIKIASGAIFPYLSSIKQQQLTQAIEDFEYWKETRELRKIQYQEDLDKFTLLLKTRKAAMTTNEISPIRKVS